MTASRQRAIHKDIIGSRGDSSNNPVGTTQDGGEILNRSVGTNRSWTVSGLPSSGQTIYVRLSTKCYGVWEYRDYTYKAKEP